MKKNSSSNGSSTSARALRPGFRRDDRATSTSHVKTLSADDSPKKPLARPSDLPLQLALSCAVAVTTPTSPPSPPAPDVDNLEGESKDFLIQRVRALERQLRIRNSDCARLFEDRKELAILKQKCESQREMILALRDQLDLAQAQRDSANDAMEAMKRQQRDKEHRDRVAYAERAIYGASVAPRDTAGNTKRPENCISSGSNAAPNATPASAAQRNNTRCAPGGTVINTASGPQIIYDSSDISSVGFARSAKLPYDFLGGPGAQLQYLSRYHGGSHAEAEEELGGGHDASEEAQVRRTMAAAAEASQLDAKYAEMEDKEHRALLARIKALREGRK
ncbi:hypothetical protein JIQ42_01905 [Leishmania sp. Namibia]|uniref:hypothetical protein n=1 Tax=Leishmania sp. Namibia TaxID=2802991 RepID=UPI001B6475C2|nr:hypothetical protein JIQ42_01905 [Leishmania sp. Namibia]